MKVYKTDKVFFVILLLICISCKSQIEASQKQKNDSTSNMENKKPKFSKKDIYKKNDPNTIELMGEVISIEHDSILCGKNYENIVIIKAQKIISVGSAIVNMLNKGKIFKVIVNKSPFLNNKSPDSIFKKGDSFQINVIEQLCIDTSKTTYLLSNFKEL